MGLPPILPRGKDFTRKWSGSAWAEKLVLDALNDVSDLEAIRLGVSDGTAFQTGQELDANRRIEANRIGKQPDILVYRKGRLGSDDRVRMHDPAALKQDDYDKILRQACFAIEIEFSPYSLVARRRARRKDLSFTVKVEDFQPTMDWQNHYGVDLAIVQVFVDESFFVAVDEIDQMIKKGQIECYYEHKIRKELYRIPLRSGSIFGRFVEDPVIDGPHHPDESGRYETPVPISRGKLEVRLETLDRIGRQD